MASTSEVWVLHIVWTTMGWSLPIRTFPTWTVRVFMGLFIRFLVLFLDHLAGQFLQLGVGVAVTGRQLIINA